jgi:tRNA-splicing ligase RtcB (3'-phosphate/5'-hydroxy nucleic acid ligase)
MGVPSDIKKITDYIWEIPARHREGMRVPARVYASGRLLGDMDDGVFDQICNVACLPGIVGHAACMPDGHWGYGFPIGGVAAFDPEEGVISPGGIGFDINCGMRLVRTGLTLSEVQPRLNELLDGLFRSIPAGVGRDGLLDLGPDEFRQAVEQGARYCVARGYGTEEDLELTEERGCFAGADASKISEKAVSRGCRQIGTLGSGNHYLEIQVVREGNVFDAETAAAFGITLPDQVVVMFHCGSRGFGHQVATDYVQAFLKTMKASRLEVKDRELACAPFRSSQGQDYFAAFTCAVNMSFANRQMILHRIREVFSDVFHRDPRDLGIHQVYDVAHNTAKLEEHMAGTRSRRLLVHRKGATRAFAPGMPGVPAAYSRTGQPVIIGGSMETGSYLLAGVRTGAQSFYTTAHGSGRTMSRAKARSLFKGREIVTDMERRGIYVRTASLSGVAEEAGGAYKDIDSVVESTEGAGLSRKIVRFVPIGNIKG